MSIISDISEFYKNNTIFDPNDKLASGKIIEDISYKINQETLSWVNSEDYRPLWQKLGFQNIIHFVMYSCNPFAIKLSIELLIHDLKFLTFFEEEIYKTLCYNNLINFFSLEEEKKLFEWYLSQKDIIWTLANLYDIKYKKFIKKSWPYQQRIFLSHLKKLFPDFFSYSFRECDFRIGPGWFGLIEKYCYALFNYCKINSKSKLEYKFLSVDKLSINSISIRRNGGDCDKSFYDLFNKLEQMSIKMCEGCGLILVKEKGLSVCKNCL